MTCVPVSGASTPSWWPGASGFVTGRGLQDVLGHVDRHAPGDAQGDGVAGAGVDVELLAPGPGDVEGGEEGVLGEVVDSDGLELGAEGLDHGCEQVVGLGALDGDALEAALDGLGLGEADDDGEGAGVAVGI